MDFSPSYLLSQRIPKLCSQNLKRDLFVCPLGGVVLPPKNDVGLFQDGLIRHGGIGGWGQCTGRRVEGGVFAKAWSILDSRLARGSSTVENFSHCSLRDVFRATKWKGSGYEDVKVIWWEVAATISDTVVGSVLTDMRSSSDSHKGDGLVERVVLSFRLETNYNCEAFHVGPIIWVIVFLRYPICFMLGGLYQKEDVDFNFLSIKNYAEFGVVGNCGLPTTIVILSSWTLDPPLFEDECCFFIANDPLEGHSCNS
ncbi:hypothetical protein V6N13_138697 [Hibiscus sabdariffa]